ncbi:interferon-inducible GTPase 1-like [Mytilus californianus]|uniref:interferon-inducible GTPase 1-like n=1 Tax=Mytilus californianus TaxID=6549 RepID=UPI002245ADEB|nr:interferon-inducible GTPase 1-like [Mytilus californianus]
MGKAEPKEVIKDGQFERVRKITDQKGPDAVKTYLQKNIYRRKEEKVSFAVTGRSATGKSTLINKVREVKPGDPGFAKSGSGNTTREPTAYENPQNKRIVFYDLPAVGTMEFPINTYVSKMKLSQYDYFFIFFDKVVSADDYFFITKLVELKKPFSLLPCEQQPSIKEMMKGNANSGILYQLGDTNSIYRSYWNGAT